MGPPSLALGPPSYNPEPTAEYFFQNVRALIPSGRKTSDSARLYSKVKHEDTRANLNVILCK